MGVSKQFKSLKENWLIVLVVVVLMLLMSGVSTFILSVFGVNQNNGGLGIYEKTGIATDSFSSIGYYPGYSADFSPEIENRKITKNSNLNLEVNRGSFEDKSSRVREIVDSTDSFILNENVQTIGKGYSSYKIGSYSIKVEDENYNFVLGELKDLGEVRSSSENSQDITSRYNDLEIELESEKERLELYKSLLNDADSVTEKVELSDRIYNLERTIKYYEDSLSGLDQKISYSTIYLNIEEEKSTFSNTGFVSLRDIFRNFVSSFNSLIVLIFVLIPWLVVIWLLRFIWRKRK